MLKLVTRDEFVDEINKIIFNDGCSVIEAICEYAESNDIEYSKLVPFINATFKNSIIFEAEQRNMMKKQNGQLPI